MARLFSTEQISKYHPDKAADQISDYLVSQAITKNPNARCGIEALVKDDTVIVAGEIGGTSFTQEEVEKHVKHVMADLGYEVNQIINLLGKQSAEISNAVENTKNIGAGDQGLMFGYATRTTETKLPFAFELANKIISLVESHVDVSNPKRLLWGDAKTQVTVNLDIYNGETVLSVDTVVLSMAYNKTEITLEELRVHFEKLLRKTFNLPNGTKVLINPSGAWTDSYGAYGDAGLTGRKIVADQYGGFVAVGGGSLSSKDLTKVDRSATYAARNIALDILDKFESVKDVEVQLAYAIGVAEPVSITTKITPTKRIATNDLTDYLAARVQDYVEYSYDLTPKGIIERLNFSPCEYYELSKGCHFRSGTYIGNWRGRK